MIKGEIRGGKEAVFSLGLRKSLNKGCQIWVLKDELIGAGVHFRVESHIKCY